MRSGTIIADNCGLGKECKVESSIKVSPACSATTANPVLGNFAVVTTGDGPTRNYYATARNLSEDINFSAEAFGYPNVTLTPSLSATGIKQRAGGNGLLYYVAGSLNGAAVTTKQVSTAPGADHQWTSAATRTTFRIASVAINAGTQGFSELSGQAAVTLNVTCH